MKAVLLIVLAFYTTTAFSQSVARLDIKNGFRNYKFGAKINTYPGMVYLSGPYGRKYYEKRPEDLRVADQRARSIQYSTTAKGLLYCISISMGRTALLNLVEIYTGIYGKPVEGNVTETDTGHVVSTNYQWSGKKVELSVNVSWDDPYAGFIRYIHDGLSELATKEMAAKDKADREKAARDKAAREKKSFNDL